MKVHMTYFRLDGKYEGEGIFVSKRLNMFDYFKEARFLQQNGLLPNMKMFHRPLHVLVEAPDHPNNYPHLLIFKGEDNG